MNKIASMLFSSKNALLCVAFIVCICTAFAFPAYVFAARVYSTGFELNSITPGVEFEVPSATGLSISGTSYRSGSYALRQNSLTNGYMEYSWLAANADSHVFIRFYFKVATLPSSTARILDITNLTGATAASLRLTSAGKVQLWNGVPAQVGPDSPALVTGLWHCLEIEYQSRNTGATDVLSARLDGAQFAASVAQTLAPVAKFRLGNTVTITGTVPDFYFDDVALNDYTGIAQNGFPGPGKIVVLMPNAPGDYQSGASGPTTGQPAWEMVNEITPNDAVDYWKLATTADNISVNIQNASMITNDDIIGFIQVGARVAGATSSSCNYYSGIKSQALGKQFNSSIVNITSTSYNTNDDTIPRNYQLTAYFDPQTTNAWTADLLNGSQIFVKTTDANPPINITSLWALVEYDTPRAIAAVASDSSSLGAGKQTGDSVVINFNSETNGYSINAANVDTVLALANGHSWLDSGSNFGSATWLSAKYANDTLCISLSNASGIPPNVAKGDYISIGANTIALPVTGENIAGPVKITGTFDGPWYYHVNSSAPVSNVGTAYQDYTNPFPPAANCWHSVADAFNAVRTGGKAGPWVIQIDDTASYNEEVDIWYLPTTADATFTLRKNPALSGLPAIHPTTGGLIAVNIGRDDQVDGNSSYVTIQGLNLSNNAAGTTTATEQAVLAVNQKNFTQGQILIENCVLDGLGQTYDSRNANMIFEIHADTIFRNNVVQNFIGNTTGTKIAGVLFNGPGMSGGGPLVGGKTLQIVNNTFRNISGIVSETIANVVNDWKLNLVMDGNSFYNNVKGPAYTMYAIESFNASTVVSNNFFYNNTELYGTLSLWNSSNAKIYHNTFYNNRGIAEIYINGDCVNGVELKNNLIYPTPGNNYAINASAGSQTNLIARNNAFYADWAANGYPSGSNFSAGENTETVVNFGGTAKTTATFNTANANISGNGYTLGGPGLVSNSDMHISANSLCVDAGTFLPSVTHDIDGDVRPQGAGYDIGADEVVDVEGGAANADPFAVNSAVPVSGLAGMTVAFDGSSSYDPDGTIVSYAWDFGDGTYGSGAAVNHTYTQAGVFNAVLTVTDNTGAFASNPTVITVSAPASQMHVASIAMSIVTVKKNNNAAALVSVVSSSGAAVPGALVTGHWSGLTSDTGFGTTSSQGTVSISSASVSKTAVGTFTFCVDSITLNGWEYDQGANAATCNVIANQ